MRTLQEWMGHRDVTTTQRYADYAPSGHEAELVEAAFGGDPQGRYHSVG
jgi:site-specific recombinase XerD